MPYKYYKYAKCVTIDLLIGVKPPNYKGKARAYKMVFASVMIVFTA